MSVNRKSSLMAEVDEEGRLVFPSELISQFDLKPGTRVRLDVDAEGLCLRRPVTHLAKVYIEPSSQCNLNCRTCIRHAWDEPLGVMSESTFSRIIQSLKEFEIPPNVFFGGLGEPLTNPNLADMIVQTKALGASVELITNGTMLDEAVSRRLVDAGPDVLWVSLDGASPEMYSDIRLGSSLPLVIANLKKFSHLRSISRRTAPEIGIAFVAMKKNIGDLPEVMRIGKELGATRLSVSNVLPYTREMCDEVLYPPFLNNETHRPSPWKPHIKFPRMQVNGLLGKIFSDAMGKGWHVSYAGCDLGTTRNDYCPFIEDGSVSIGWDGNLSPCLPLLHNHVSFFGEQQRHSGRHVIGNVNDQNLRDLWLSPEYVRFREKVQAFEFSPCTFCSGCDLSEDNREDCIGNTFPACGGCLWAQGVIQCP